MIVYKTIIKYTNTHKAQNFTLTHTHKNETLNNFSKLPVRCQFTS
jgi:hypothetical protein